MLRLALGTLRTRIAGFAGAFLAVLLAAVLVTGAGVLMESALRAHTPVERLDGTDFAVAASRHLERTPAMGKAKDGETLTEDAPKETARIPADLAARIAAVPGVQAAVADRTVPVVLPDGSTVEAHGWDSAQLAPYRLTAGQAPAAGQAVLDEATAARLGTVPGGTVQLATPAGARTVTVSGIADAPAPAGAKPAVFLPADQTAALSAVPDRADFVGVVLAPGADRDAVRGALDGIVREAGPQFGDPARPQPKLHVLSGGSLGRLEAPAVTGMQDATTAVAGTFGGFAATAAIFVVAGTFGFSVTRRTREIGLLRAVGATPGQIRRMISAEALLVALAAAGIGTPLGYLFARVLKALFGHAGALPPGFALHDGWIPAVVGIGAAVLTTQIAALAAAFRAAKVKPTEVFGATPGKRRIVVPVLRWLLGLAGIGGGIALLIVSLHLSGDDGASSSVGIVFTFMFGVAMLGRPIARLGVALVGRLTTLFGGAPAQLARANGASDPARISAVATPIALTVAFICTVLFLNTTVATETVAQSKARTTADFVVDGADRAGVGADAVARIAGLPGVASASGTVATTVLDGSATDATVADARGIGPETSRVLDLGVRSGDLAQLTGDGTVAVGKLRADGMGKDVGDRVRLWLGDGTPVSLRIVAVYDHGFGFGDFLLPRDVALRHSTVGAYDKVYVSTAPGADKAAVARALAAEGHVLDRAAYLGEVRHDADRDAWASALLLGVIGLFTAIGVVNTMVMATGQRGREFAVLRLSGTTRRQAFAMLRHELAVVAAIGIGLGTAIAWVTLGAFSHGITGTWAPDLPVGRYLAVAGGALAITYAASVLSARTVLRDDPVAAIGARE